MISSILEQQQAHWRDKVELAVQLLESEYKERLSKDDFVNAIELLTEKSKASVFITLNSIDIRDL
jgi:hypothetical protein